MTRPIEQLDIAQGVIGSMIAKGEYPDAEIALLDVLRRVSIEVATVDQNVSERLLERVNSTSAVVRRTEDRMMRLGWERPEEDAT